LHHCPLIVDECPLDLIAFPSRSIGLFKPLSSQAGSKSQAQANPRLPYSLSRNPTNQKQRYISQYFPYSILHINLTPTLSVPYLRLACAWLSLGPILSSHIYSLYLGYLTIFQTQVIKVRQEIFILANKVTAFNSIYRLGLETRVKGQTKG